MEHMLQWRKVFPPRTIRSHKDPHFRYGCCDAVTGEPIDELPDVHAPPKTPNSPKAPTTAYGLYEDFDQNFAGMSIGTNSTIVRFYV